MNRWSARERRWRDALLDAMLPRLAPPEGDGRPGLADLPENDLDAFWSEVDRVAPPLFAFGLRAAVWVLHFSPLVLVGRPRTFLALSAGERDRCLARAAKHRIYVLRQLVTTLKVVACFAYFRSPAARAAVLGAGEGPR